MKLFCLVSLWAALSTPAWATSASTAGAATSSSSASSAASAASSPAPPAPPTYDFIVVGSGPGGATVTRSLVCAGWNVLLLEAGDSDLNVSPSIFDLNQFYELATATPSVSWNFSTIAEPGLNNRSCPVEVMRAVGGCSSHNAAIWNRGSAYDFTSWSALLKDPSWGPSSIQSYFRRLESFRSGTSPDRGRTGPITVARSEVQTSFQSIALSVSQLLGYPYLADYNSGVGEREGSSLWQFVGFGDMRENSYTAMLRPIYYKKNLNIAMNAVVTKIIFNNQKVAIGVQYTYNGQNLTAYAAKEVILSAGTINTPKLLQLSGVGDPVLLNSLKIPVVASSAQVGKNLHDHLNGFQCYLTNQSLPDYQSVFTSQIVGSLDGTSGQHAPDFQIYVLGKNGGTPGFLDALGPLKSNLMCLFGAPLNPKSRGSVNITSSNYLVAPNITFNYLTDQHDVNVTKFIGQVMDKFVSSPQFVAAYGPTPLATYQNEGFPDFLSWVRAAGTSVWHPVGTAALGTVVDTQLRVIGVSNLRVVDASVMPSITSGNTQATTYAIGLKAGDMLLNTYGLNLNTLLSEPVYDCAVFSNLF